MIQRKLSANFRQCRVFNLATADIANRALLVHTPPKSISPYPSKTSQRQSLLQLPTSVL